MLRPRARRKKNPLFALQLPHRTSVCDVDATVYLFPRQAASAGNGWARDRGIPDGPRGAAQRVVIDPCTGVVGAPISVQRGHAGRPAVDGRNRPAAQAAALADRADAGRGRADVRAS